LSVWTRCDRAWAWLVALVVGLLAVDALHGQAIAAGSEVDDAPVAVLMVLSSRMPYALQEWPRMKRVAKRAGFIVLAARDSRVPSQEWAAAVSARDLFELRDVPVLDEQMGIDLGLLHHAPSSLVVRCGVWHPWPILGVMPDQAWVELLRHRAAQLRERPCS